MQKACSRFYWHDMTNDIKEHVRTCDTCQRTNRKLSKASAKLHPIPVRSEVWHQVGIDLVGPLTLSRNNNRYRFRVELHVYVINLIMSFTLKCIVICNRMGEVLL